MAKKINIALEFLNEGDENSLRDDFKQHLRLLISKFSDQGIDQIQYIDSAETRYEKLVALSILSDAMTVADGASEPHLYVERADRLRSYNVLLQSFSENNIPEHLKRNLTFNLTGNGIQTGSQLLGEGNEKYWNGLVDLAFHIAAFYKSDNPSKSTHKTVFLAEPTPDLRLERDEIRRDLLIHGVRVLPRGESAIEHDDLQEQVERNLRESDLSIHLIGNDYGNVIPSVNKSIPDYQNAIASQYGVRIRSEQDKKNFKRIIWIRPDGEYSSDQQRNFIQNIKRDAESLKEAELFRLPLEHLKSIIREKVFRESKPVEEALAQEGGEKGSIYLIFDKDDEDQTKEIADYFDKSGYHTIVSTFNKDLIDLRNLHYENLRNCDACFIFRGRASEQWAVSKMQDVIKIPGMGREKDMHSVALYNQNNGLANASFFEDNNALIINEESKFDKNLLTKFLEQTQNGR